MKNIKSTLEYRRVKNQLESFNKGSISFTTLLEWMCVDEEQEELFKIVLSCYVCGEISVDDATRKIIEIL